ncbi:MAG: HEAT repeat domain-containing protein [Spirochaetales bacterium]|nr:HEAT repeat domain-containing protein [Spirochaetales bacterium]
MKKGILTAMIDLDTRAAWKAVLQIYFSELNQSILSFIFKHISAKQNQSQIIDILGWFMEIRLYPDKKIFNLLGKLKDNIAVFTFCKEQLENKSNYTFPLRRKKLIWLLSSFHQEETTKIIIEVLEKDWAKEIRMEAAKILGKITDKITVPALIKTILCDTDTSVRKAALESFYFIPDKRVTPVVCDLLMQGKKQERSLRLTALKILCVIKDKKSLPVLFHLYEHEIDTELRTFCLKAMGEIPDESVILLLKEQIMEERIDILRTTAGEILTWLGWKAETEPEQTYHDIALHKWDAVKAKGLSAAEPLMHILKVNEDSPRQNVDEEIDNVITEIYSAVKKVYFGDKSDSAEPDTVINPLIDDLKRPLRNLEKIIIDATTFDRELLEKFITHLINSLGEPFVKRNIPIYFTGDHSTINKNLLNTLQNVFNRIETES